MLVFSKRTRGLVVHKGFPEFKENSSQPFPLIKESIGIFVLRKRKVYEKRCH